MKTISEPVRPFKETVHEGDFVIIYNSFKSRELFLFRPRNPNKVPESVYDGRHVHQFAKRSIMHEGETALEALKRIALEKGLRLLKFTGPPVEEIRDLMHQFVSPEEALKRSALEKK